MLKKLITLKNMLTMTFNAEQSMKQL